MTLPLNPILLTQALDALQCGVMIFDDQGRCLLWNRWLAEHSGRPADSMLGQRFEQLFPNLAGGRVHNAVTVALIKGLSSVLSQTLNRAPFDLEKPGAEQGVTQRIQQAIQVLPLPQADGSRYCLLQINDVTQVVQREEILRRHAGELLNYSHLDPLTGVPNRRSLNDLLDEEWRRARRGQLPIAMLMIDIDHFKQYNAHFGHAAGDHCLQQIAAAMAGALRRASDQLTRYGGEEFVILLPETNQSGARAVAEATMAAVRNLQIAHPEAVVGSAVLSISVGVAAFEQDLPQLQPADLISAADAALFHAKRGGGNRLST